MAVAEHHSKMTLRRTHPGGFFLNLPRGDRDQVVLQLASEAKQLAVIASTDAEAKSFAERLTLSGLPVFLATDTVRNDTLAEVIGDGVSTLVSTHDFVVGRGPIRVPMAIHLRVPRSVREYSRRLEAVPSSAHITFVIPDDEGRADSLQSYLRNDRGHGHEVQVSLTDVIDLTDSATTASVPNVRRRFPLRD